MTPLVVLYDGDCGFCRWAVAHLHGRPGFDLRPLASAPEAPEPSVRTASERFDLTEALTTVEPATGATARGGDAILAIALRLPGGALLQPWLRVAPFRAAVRALYRLVAANRDRLVRLGMRA